MKYRGVETNLISTLSAGKWTDRGHLEMKGEEHNIMKVSNWLITEKNTSMN